jgi:hypothetical protein
MAHHTFVSILIEEAADLADLAGIEHDLQKTQVFAGRPDVRRASVSGLVRRTTGFPSSTPSSHFRLAC